MFYYSIALLASPLDFLTYQSSQDIPSLSLVNVSLRSTIKTGLVLAKVKQPQYETLEIDGLTSLYFSPQQYSLATFISNYYFSSLGEALNLFTSFNKKISHTVKNEEVLLGCKENINKPKTNISLSEIQNKALQFSKKHPITLLFGDTGSGKTEIYMKYFQELTCKGKRALFLLPEISLTPQMQIRFEKHFGDAFVLWHSKMTKKQKSETLEKILSGEAMIIAGPRSALFLPIENLGIIVVDEEHDDSYKSSSKPRYHARDVAIYMAHKLSIPIVLGSATPSLSSYVKFPYFRLRGGYHSSKKEFIFEPSREEISPLIEESLKHNHSKKRQAIMFIPTRANFKYMICDSCGYTLECPFCSVGMSLHVRSNALKCHYCSYMEPIPKVCPKCSSAMLENSRLGTAEAMRYFKEHQSQLKTLQFDRDTITTQNKLKKALQSFNNGEIDLLIGTQMLSKGHDYHDVTLAIVMGLDNMLQLPDYRSREKTLALLIQIAGRAGRRHNAKVIVQSFFEQFFRPYIEDFDAFLEDEKKVRHDLYPPYKKLARILFAHKSKEKASEAMHEMADKIRHYNEVEIVGSGASAIERIANKYRFQILLRSDKSTSLLRVVKATKNKLAQIDMDPVEFS
ncbi:MAG: primosomal protein N' [Campylobacterota bacterium]|nr:primosomal protein N' [Campylobacterota bacterium]